MLRRVPDEHLIDTGRVYCPVRGRDVEFDVCAGCRWSMGIDLQARFPVVRCRPERPPLWLIRPWL
ncbi:MAG TPA: hypothetical protein VEV21_13125 [Burkholderiales bacterium]|nr:hypothetical protein [Burkholderiales bacterium]